MFSWLFDMFYNSSYAVMCVIVKNMLFLSTNILHFRERISLMKMRFFFQRVWQIMLFLYLYQIYIIQYWTSKRSSVWSVIQTIERHYVSTRVGRKKSWIYTIFRILNISTTHGNWQFKYQTLISCKKKCGLQGYHTNFVIRGFFRLGWWTMSIFQIILLHCSYK